MTSAPSDHILVVDDDQEIQRLLRGALEAKGFRVDTADDGLAAVDFLKANPTDLVVLDLLIPSLDGWAAMAEVQRLPSPPPVVVITGAAEINITPRIFREGVAAFIAKPFQLEVLINACQELIARAKGREQVYDERRRGQRRTLALRVELQGLDAKPLYPGRIVNLSAHGAQVELAAALPPGERVRLVYRPPKGDPWNFECCVQWWRRAAAPSNVTSHGLAFTRLSAGDQERVKELAALG